MSGRTALAILLAVLAAGCSMREEPKPGAARPITALVGGRVQPAPDAPAIADGVVVIEGRAVTAVGPRGEVRIPAGAVVLDCAGATVSAGFWNSHVHFTQSVWDAAGSAPAERLAAGLRAMLTSYGFVRVVDTGSPPPNTLALRRRIERGEVPGLAILTAGGGLVPGGGTPFYLLPTRLPELATPAAAEPVVATMIGLGADVVKLFTGSSRIARRSSSCPSTSCGRRWRRRIAATGW